MSYFIKLISDSENDREEEGDGFELLRREPADSKTGQVFRTFCKGV